MATVKRQNIGQIRSAPDAPRRDGNRDPITDHGADCVGYAIALRTAAEHLRQLLTTTTAFFMAAAATALLHFDQG
jgi:hypothetical protein